MEWALREWSRRVGSERRRKDRTGDEHATEAVSLGLGGGGTHMSSGEEGLLQQGTREAATQSQCECCSRSEQLRACPLQVLVEFTVTRHKVWGPPGCSQESADLKR
jgi:hypothetical protein